jgi:hypothetical protein
VFELQPQQVALELEHPGGRLLLKQGGHVVEQGLEAAGGDQDDGQQAQAPRPGALAPLVLEVPVGGLNGPASA